ncbi:hypothetical protein SAMN04487890_102124 [Mucilaginibacter polytrichastri]|nr:hypothetical protein SAMN04487890_102124 [Mucilaginibacter polytrichastri]
MAFSCTDYIFTFLSFFQKKDCYQGIVSILSINCDNCDVWVCTMVNLMQLFLYLTDILNSTFSSYKKDF